MNVIKERSVTQMQTFGKFFFHAVLGLWLLAFTVPSLARASDDQNPDFLPMMQRNCAPNGYDASPELYLVYYPDVLTSSKSDTAFACSHGFPWEADTRVPLILYGAGIRKGTTSENAASLEDITPTIAHLLAQQPPEDADGRILTEALLHKDSCRQFFHRKARRPRMAVVFTLDQCRADYLTDPQIAPALRFTRHVLMGRGVSYPNARLSYAGSRTAVSHATVGTGATPGVHGIIGNNIRLEDAFPLALNGSPRHSMEMFNLITPTLADIMDLELDNRSVVISMSPYGRAALGMAGHGAAFDTGSDKDIVLKMARDTGLPYTNTEYFQLPEYLTYSPDNPIRIDQWLAQYYGVDIHTANWAQDTIIVDQSPYALNRGNVIIGPQGAFPDETAFEFSYPIVRSSQPVPTSTVQLWNEDHGYPKNTYFEETMYTPYYTLWATDMLLRTMAQEGVGRDRIADLVYYNFKCLDKIGHRYGVSSPEIYSYLYTVDYCLKKIKHFLDWKVGHQRYVMVVTSDHGAHNAYDERILYRADLFNAIEDTFGKDVILNDPGDGAPFDDMIYLDREVLGNNTLSEVAQFVESRFSEYVYRAYTKDEIFSGE
jgi:predicted AlkP superfamily pyrophosphatase or phosphodiesterase